MEVQIENKRSAYWDNIKGILILLTVFAHILFQLQEGSEIINKTVDLIYMFHMPAFVFVSGFFGKSERSRSFESIIKLIFLYYIFNSIIGFIYGFESLLNPLYSYWYLIALIVWRVTAHYIAKFKEINLILFVVALFAGFYSSIDNTFAVARIIGFYPFYMSGYLLSKEKSREMIEKKYSKRVFTGLFIGILSFVFSFFIYEFFEYSDLDLQMGAYNSSTGSFGRIVIYIIAFSYIFAFRLISPNKRIPLITMFGENSLWIFILHRPVTLIVSDLIGKMSIPAIMIISFAVSVLTCIILGNRYVSKYMDSFLKSGVSIFTEEKKEFTIAKLALLLVSLGFIVSLLINLYIGFSLDDFKKYINGEYSEDSVIETEGDDYIYNIMSSGQENEFDNAFKITFAGRSGETCI